MSYDAIRGSGRFEIRTTGHNDSPSTHRVRYTPSRVSQLASLTSRGEEVEKVSLSELVDGVRPPLLHRRLPLPTCLPGYETP